MESLGIDIDSNTTPMDDIWIAFGDTTNPGVLVNCESIFNGVKMQVWQVRIPLADTTWDGNDFDGTTLSTGYIAAEGDISTFRLAAAILFYLNDRVIHANMANILNTMHNTFMEFDNAVETATGNTIQTAGMLSEFVYVLIPELEIRTSMG